MKTEDEIKNLINTLKFVHDNPRARFEEKVTNRIQIAILKWVLSEEETK